MWQSLINPIASVVGSFVESRVEKQKGKTKVAVAKAEAEAEVYKQTSLQEGNWDKIMAEGSRQSLKDEWLTILFSVPLILAFIPGAEGIVESGFRQLEMMPTWYQYSLGVIVAASFGVRSATKFFGKR